MRKVYVSPTRQNQSKNISHANLILSELIVLVVTRLTSDGAGSQQVNDVNVVSKVNENLQLRHQRLLLRGVSVGWDDIITTLKWKTYKHKIKGRKVKVFLCDWRILIFKSLTAIRNTEETVPVVTLVAV